VEKQPATPQTSNHSSNAAALLTKQQRIASQSFNPINPALFPPTAIAIASSTAPPPASKSSENKTSASEQLNHVNVYSNIGTTNNNNLTNFHNNNVNKSPNSNLEATTNIISNNYNKNEVIFFFWIPSLG
jgi:hypothetical protein